MLCSYKNVFDYKVKSLTEVGLFHERPRRLEMVVIVIRKFIISHNSKQKLQQNLVAVERLKKKIPSLPF